MLSPSEVSSSWSSSTTTSVTSAQLLGCGALPGSACNNSSSSYSQIAAVASHQHDAAPSSNIEKVEQWLSNMELRAATNVSSNHFSSGADAGFLSAEAGSTLPPTSRHATAQQQQEEHATSGKRRFKQGLSLTATELMQLEHPCKMSSRAVKQQQLPPPAFVLLGIPM
jgi:hypothetical protein